MLEFFQTSLFFALSCFQIVFCSIKVAYDTNIHEGTVFLALTDLFFAWDIGFEYFLKKEAKRKYKWNSRAFITDTIATLPVYFLGNRWFLLIKLLRLFRLQESMLLISRKFAKDTNIQRMIRLFALVALCCHVIGCGFYLTSVEVVNEKYCETWPEVDGLWELKDGSISYLASIGKSYVRSVYWSTVTMITTGFGDITPANSAETFYTTVTMYVGVSLTCSAIANLTNLMLVSQSRHTKHQEQLKTIAQFVKLRGITPQLSDLIMYYHQHFQGTISGPNSTSYTQRILKEFDVYPSLKNHITTMHYRKIFEGSIMFRKFTDAHVNNLAEMLQTRMYPPKEKIMTTAKDPGGLIILGVGRAEVLFPHKTPLQAGSGAVFGERSLLSSIRPFFSLRAATFCHCWILPRDVFQKVTAVHCTEEECLRLRHLVHESFRSKFRAGSSVIIGQLDNKENVGIWRRQLFPGSFMSNSLAWLRFYTLAMELISFGVFIAFFYSHYWNSGSSHIPMIGFQAFLWMGDMFLAFDFVMRLCMLVQVDFKTHEFVVRPRKLLNMYLSSEYSKEYIKYSVLKIGKTILEIFAFLPWELLCVIGLIEMKYFVFLRLPKMVLLLNWKSFLNGRETAAQNSRFVISAPVRRMIDLFMYLVIFSHFVAAGWSLLGSMGENPFSFSSGIISGGTWTEMDIQENEYILIDHSDWDYWMNYIRSFYYSIVAMSTVGYGDIASTNVPESIYSILLLLFGGLVYPSVVGVMAAFMSEVQADFTRFKTDHSNLKLLLERLKLPPEVSERVLHYHKYSRAQHNGVSEKSVIKELPSALAGKVMREVTASLTDRVTFFSEAPVGFLEELSKRTKMRIYIPGDIIIEPGQVSTNFIMLERGTVNITDSTGNLTFSIMRDGDYFGEECFVRDSIRKSMALAVTHCDCLLVSRKSLNESLEMYVSYGKKLNVALGAYLKQKSDLINKAQINLSDYPKLLNITSFSALPIQSFKGFRFLDPLTTIRVGWTMLCFLLNLFSCAFLPVQLAFLKTDIHSVWALMAPWVFVDLIFIIDMMLHAKYLPFESVGELERRPEAIWQRYRVRHFKLDILTMLPFDWIVAGLFLCFGYDESLFYIVLLRLPRLLRCRRMRSQMSMIEEKYRNLPLFRSPALFRIFKVFILILILGNLAGCLFILTARMRNDDESCALDSGLDCLWKQTWIGRSIEERLLPSSGGSLISRYLRGLNWALPTLVVVVIGDAVPCNRVETLFVVGAVLLGVSINALLIGNIVNTIMRLESPAEKQYRLLDMMERFMADHEISPHLRVRVRSYLQWRLATSDISAELHECLVKLPLTLRGQVKQALYFELISSCDLFKGLDGAILKLLINVMRVRHYCHGDVVARMGHQGSVINIILHGRVAVLSADNTIVYNTLERGRMFGESALLGQQRAATVIAIDMVEVLELSKKNFDIIFERYPEAKENVLNIAEELRNLNAERNASVEDNFNQSCYSDSRKLVKIFSEMFADEANSKTILNSKQGFKGAGKRSSMWNSIILKLHKLSIKLDSGIYAVWQSVHFVGMLFYLLSFFWLLAFFIPDCEDGSDSCSRRSSSFTTSWRMLAVGYLMDVLFWIGTYLRHVALQNTQDNEKIKERTVSVFLDIVSGFPYELILLPFASSHSLWWVFIRLPRLFRLRRLNSAWSVVVSYLRSRGVPIRTSSLRIGECLLAYVVMNHIYGCMWFIIHRHLEHDESSTWAVEDGLATFSLETGKHNILNDNLNVWTPYLRAFYFVITVASTVGYGDIRPYTNMETGFQITVVLTAACMFAALIGSLALYFQHIDESSRYALREKEKAKLKKFIRTLNLPSNESESLMKHQHELFQHNHGWDFRSLLQELPQQLRREVYGDMRKVVLDVVQPLRELPEGSRLFIAEHLRPLPVIKGTRIYQAGDVVGDIYFIDQGEIVLRYPQGSTRRLSARKRVGSEQWPWKVDKRLKDGDHFGEGGLVEPQSTMDHRASATKAGLIFALAKSSLQEVMNMLPDIDKDELVARLLRVDDDYSELPMGLVRDLKRVRRSSIDHVFQVMKVSSSLAGADASVLEDINSHKVIVSPLLKDLVPDDKQILRSVNTAKSFPKLGPVDWELDILPTIGENENDETESRSLFRSASFVSFVSFGKEPVPSSKSLIAQGSNHSITQQVTSHGSFCFGTTSKAQRASTITRISERDLDLQRTNINRQNGLNRTRSFLGDVAFDGGDKVAPLSQLPSLSQNSKPDRIGSRLQQFVAQEIKRSTQSSDVTTIEEDSSSESNTDGYSSAEEAAGFSSSDSGSESAYSLDPNNGLLVDDLTAFDDEDSDSYSDASSCSGLPKSQMGLFGSSGKIVVEIVESSDDEEIDAHV